MSCLVHVASPLRDYTHGAATVRAEGATLAELLANLDRLYPGMRFRVLDEQQRIRPHIRIFVDAHEARTLDHALASHAAVHLLCALSGG